MKYKIYNMKENTTVTRMALNVNDRTYMKLYKNSDHFSISKNLQISTPKVQRYFQHDNRKHEVCAVKTPNKTKDTESIRVNNAYNEDHYTVFRKCTMVLLIFFQIIGVFPVLGILEEDPSKLRFTIYSGRFVYSMFTLMLQIIITFMLIFTTVKEVTIAKCVLLLYYSFGTILVLLFIRAASKWPSLSKEVALSGLEVDPQAKVLVICAFFITLFVGVLELILFNIASYARALDCYPDDVYQSLIENNFGYFFELGIDFNVVFGIGLQFSTTMGSLCWIGTDVCVICISIYLKSLFDELCKKIRISKNKDLPSSYWKNLRKQYTESTRLVRLLDDVMNAMIFVNFSGCLVFICFQVYNILHVGIRSKVDIDCPNYPSRPLGGYEQPIYVNVSAFTLLARSITIPLVASTVHTASLNIAPELYEVPSSIGNEINRFIEQVHGETVTLTGCQCFNIRRGIVLTVAGTIVTYELVLMQFNVENIFV